MAVTTIHDQGGDVRYAMRDFGARLAAWLTNAEPPVRRDYDLDLTRRLLILAAFVGTLLAVPGLVLTDLDLRAGFPGVLAAWRIADSALLVPVYVLLTCTLCLRMAAALAAEQAPAWMHWFLRAGVLAVTCTAACDLVENHLHPAWATAAKDTLATLTAGLLLAPSLCWYFEIGLGVGLRYRRADLRWAVADIVWRSRYVLALLGLFAVLILGMDQGRDVLVGLAQAVQQAERPDEWAVAVSCLAISALATWTLAYVSWLWTRILLRASRTDAGVARLMMTRAGATAAPNLGQQFVARWWCRILGTVPIVILVWLCGFAAHDAARIDAIGIVFYLYGFAAFSAAGAWLLLWQRQRKQEDLSVHSYYDAEDGQVFADDLDQPRYAVRGIRRAPLSVPLFALAMFVLLRGFALIDPQVYGQTNVPPLSLAAIGFILAFWGSLLGRLALAALRQQRPWMLVLALGVGLLGMLGYTENHAIWQWAPGFVRADDPVARLSKMFAAQAAIACALGLLLWTLFTWRRAERGIARHLVLLAGVAVILVGTLVASDRGNARQTGSIAFAPRPTLDAALAQWFDRLCAEHHCDARANDAVTPIPVYFVTAEGGGIRAAYWTAIVLDELGVDRTKHPRFATHAFSLSGVSGGSFGMATWRSCLQASGGALDCSNRLGTAGLLTPLLSAWLMEDTVARVLPTSMCEAPACNVLDRGSWFEASMEEALPQMRRGLTTLDAPPYLFLNSTTVETGERSIASPVRIHYEQFATARDQLAWLGGDPGIAGAAHNSARFTYVNAIGAIRRSACDADDPTCARDAQRGQPIVSRLADGGYFDNSGGLTTLEILRAFERCLIEGCAGSSAQEARLAWLRARLEPRIVMIRNGLPREEQQTTDAASADAKGLCQVDAKGKRLTPKEAAQPRCSDSLPFYPDLLAPPITAFNVGGTGVAARLAEAQLTKEVRRVRAVLRRAPMPIAASAADAVAPDTAAGAPVAAANAGSAPATECIDLREDATLYPLGWYLSTMARGGMLAQRIAYFNGTRPLGCDEQRQAAQASARLGTLAEREPSSEGLSAAW